MLMTDEVCGSCKYNHRKQDDDFTCGNYHSDYFTSLISWDFSCEFWEAKEKQEGRT